MSRYRAILLAGSALFLVALLASLTAGAILAAPQEPGAGFSIPWWTVDSGGGASQGGDFAITGTIGQPDAAILSGGSYTLTCGFWSKAGEFSTYLPLITR